MRKLFDLTKRRARDVDYYDSCGYACDVHCRAESVRRRNVTRATRWTPGRIV